MRFGWIIGTDGLRDDFLLMDCIAHRLDPVSGLPFHEPPKQEIRRCPLLLEESVARGVFGAPTFFVGKDMFWGQDRLDFVAEALSRKIRC